MHTAVRIAQDVFSLGNPSFRHHCGLFSTVTRRRTKKKKKWAGFLENMSRSSWFLYGNVLYKRMSTNLIVVVVINKSCYYWWNETFLSSYWLLSSVISQEKFKREEKCLGQVYQVFVTRRRPPPWAPFLGGCAIHGPRTIFFSILNWSVTVSRWTFYSCRIPMLLISKLLQQSKWCQGEYSKIAELRSKIWAPQFLQNNHLFY